MINSLEKSINVNSKNIFITDLDGTLLTSDKKVSRKSVEIINNLIDNGLKFSVATARTPATVTEILKDLKLELPVICMNGSAIYSLKDEKYILYHILSKKAYNSLISIIKENGSNCLVYLIKNNSLYVYCDEIKNQAQQEFYEERKNLSLKKFVNEEVEEGDIIFLMLLDKTQIIDNIYEDILKSDIYNDITMTKYKDIYNSDDYSYLEIYDKKASKKNGVKYLKNYANAEKLIVFGDNLNDISMLEEGDISFAVENAAKEVKEIAHRIIGTNNEDSVARAIRDFRD